MSASSTKDLVVGIDLGTTYSSVAIVRDGRPELVDLEDGPLLRSAVGYAPDGTLLVGRPARNQAVAHPERTVLSVKRHMAESTTFDLGVATHTPVEVSALLLRRLKLAAEEALGRPVERAVITVPAYFSDAQRTATREAGEVAGLRVERMIHEPTAAALCYTAGQDAAAQERRLFLVYDLGGGTFDVSIVRSEGGVTEVLASHGDTALGGDDFDELLRGWMLERFEAECGVDLLGDRVAMARLLRAAEVVKIRLSSDAYARVAEENLATVDGVPRHLDAEISRREYEDLVGPWIDKTKDSTQVALREAKVLARELDEVILVGGSTRTPLVREMLGRLLGRAPRVDVDPDKAVALGAAIQAARVAGERVGGLLVDVTPFSFGVACHGMLRGRPSSDRYEPILHRNSPLPARATEVLYTMWPGQDGVDVRVYQGEDDDVRRNLSIGRFFVEGLDEEADANSDILFEMRLDLDGILHVGVTEKHTGLSKAVTIEDAFRKLTDADVADAARRVAAAFGPGAAGEEAASGGPKGGSRAREIPPPPDLPAEHHASWVKAQSLVERARRMSPELAAADRDEVADLVCGLEEAMTAGAIEGVVAATDELGDVLFYLE